MFRIPQDPMMKTDWNQTTQMKYDPAFGIPRPQPNTAKAWREWHGEAAWLFNPWTGERRSAYDVGSDVFGLLIIPSDEPLLQHNLKGRS